MYMAVGAMIEVQGRCPVCSPSVFLEHLALYLVHSQGPPAGWGGGGEETDM